MKLKDKKIRIISYVHSVDEEGFGYDAWQPIHSGRLWAYYRHMSGSEFYASAMVNETEEVVFAINFRADITAEMMIEYSGKYYEITRIDNFEGYKDDLNIYCKLAADQNIDVIEPTE